MVAKVVSLCKMTNYPQSESFLLKGPDKFSILNVCLGMCIGELRLMQQLQGIIYHYEIYNHMCGFQLASFLLKK